MNIIRKRDKKLDEVLNAYIEKNPSIHKGLSTLRIDEIYTQLADHWAKSSLIMRDVVEQSGGFYFHFLQPNQYVQGSKPMTQAEKSVALAKDITYKKHVSKGYPALLAASQVLKDNSVWFEDLSEIFAKTETPLYVDTCCHLSEQGNRMLAEKISETITRRLGAR